jgi:glyceraldehyde 3-phosphate dehydrogenase
MGQYPGVVEQINNKLIIDGHEIEILQELDPSNIDWHKRAIDWVVECSGQFTKREGAEKHLKAGAKAVLISAPAEGEDVAIIPGVNDAQYEKQKHRIVSLGSCTTNAFLPMLKVLHEVWAMDQGLMMTTHAYTNSQALLDVDGKDPRRSRAAALNLCPTTTGAAKMVGKIIPALADKVDAYAVRAPIGIVSLLTIVFTSAKNLTIKALNDSFAEVAAGSLKGIVAISFDPLVSSDYQGTSHSVIIDGLMTQVIKSQATISGWYDNEWAYSCRMKDFLLDIA